MFSLPNGTKWTTFPQLRWTLKLCFIISSVVIITTIYLLQKQGFIMKESFQKPESTTHIQEVKQFNTKEKKSYLENIGKNDSISNIHIIQQDESLKKKRLPQALVIGVKKCGTTALMDMIGLHPQVVLPLTPKPWPPYEWHFFEKSPQGGGDKLYPRGLEWYRNRMPPSYQDQITIEKTASYFISVDAPQRIYEMNSSIKLIIVVREPTTRIVSDYIHTKLTRESFNPMPFEKHVFKWNEEVDTGNQLVKPSLYALHMTRWLQVFKREQFLIVDGDKFVSDPLTVMTRVEKFLNLSPYLKADNFFWDPSKGFYCMRSKDKDWCMGKEKGRTHPQIDSKFMSKLRNFFAPINEEFYRMVGHNFSWPTS